MPMPGAGDSYFYEWYVGLENVIKMLDSDSGIKHVIFQHDEYDAIDDVVVEYTNGDTQVCYQVKHNIGTAAQVSLTFGSILESEKGKKCLFEAMLRGWKKASAASSTTITPVLFTNRRMLNRRTKRHLNGIPYSAYGINDFILKMQSIIQTQSDSTDLVIGDEALRCQWEELCNILSSVEIKDLISFVSCFRIEANQPSLGDMRQSLVDSIVRTFRCNEGVAWELFAKLLVGLTEWTTTERQNREVVLEDVYSVLSIEPDLDDGQHRLIPPYPFFESRKAFCEALVNQIRTTKNNVVFISGNPGSGKTSVISYIQAEHNLFSLRYHTFKPISPEQRFYNTDPGMCTQENLWRTLLTQLRKKMKGHLAEYGVPVSNKLISIDKLRGEVMRLLGILAQEAVRSGERIYVCIDGIDHAARANADVSFLDSLPIPEELPEGVCFIIVGQPIALYQEQYPLWLSTRTDIEKADMPMLNVCDIEQLIIARANQFEGSAADLAKLIFEKTEGNNLSAVFAVEEIRALHTLEEAVAHYQQSGICGNIQQYYDKIWGYMKNDLSKIIHHTIYPESIVACPLLLMNGKVNTRILAQALKYGMSANDWTMVLDRLFPLIVQTDIEGEYALFHNDFRVFLMGVIQPYQVRYKEIALALAEYLLQNNEGLLSYTMGIPLLQCADCQKYIPKYFTPEFVINALAEGVSKNRLDEFAHLSYSAACVNKDYKGYRTTYLSIKTLHQHIRYYEDYQRRYVSNDFPEISAIDISEIKSLPVARENLEAFSNVLVRCSKLFSAGNDGYNDRALALYHKWFDGLSPLSFVSLLPGDITEENAWEIRTSEVGLFLQHWGTVAAELNIPLSMLDDNISILESYAALYFGGSYFKCCIEYKKYQLAKNAIETGYVTQQAFSEKIEDIYYTEASQEFADVLLRVKHDEEKPSMNLLAQAMKISIDSSYVPERSVLAETPKIKHVYDESSYDLVLKAFLLGCIECALDDKKLIELSDEYCSEIEGNNTEKSQVCYLARAAVLLGKYYWNNESPSDMFEGYSEWLLMAELYRPFDYSRARRFILFSLLHSNAAEHVGKTSDFLDALRTNLFEIDHLGMYYKTDILDFLVKHDQLAIVSDYIEALYGENCSRISGEESKAEMHERFREYGNLVNPELIAQFDAQLKWDVVGYLGTDEYAMYAPLECFNEIIKLDASKWSSLGERLYKQSKIADLFGNKASYEIDSSLLKASASCGISDYWELRKWNDGFALNPNHIYKAALEFVNTAKHPDDLKAIWILCVGIHSWYTQSEQQAVKCIYNECVKKSVEFDFRFDLYASQITPQWVSIIVHLCEKDTLAEEPNEYSIQKEREMEALHSFYNPLSVDEAIDSLVLVENERWAQEHYAIVLKKILESNADVAEKLSKFLNSFSIYMQGKSWAHNNYEFIITTLLSVLGYEAFWSLAQTMQSQLSDYDYQTSMRNMQLLFRLNCALNSEETEALFDEEIRTQLIWASGNGHFEINVSEEYTERTFANTPKSFSEMALYVLLEQIDSQNARKIESSIYALYLLGLQFSQVVDMLIANWKCLSQSQQECMLVVFAKWAIESACVEPMRPFIRDMYDNCAELTRKYYLHSLLLKLKDDDIEETRISYDAPSNGYELPCGGIEETRSRYENFLRAIERYSCDKDIKAIRRYISEIGTLETYVNDPYAENGDSRLPIMSELPERIFYDKEKTGDWSSTPLTIKKAHLIPGEDPFLLTEMPLISFDEKWFPNISIKYDGQEHEYLSTDDLHNISRYNISDDETVLAASLWYPWGHKEGTIYNQSSKIGLPYDALINNGFDKCIGNFGLLANENAIDELFVSEIGSGGIGLFSRVCGNLKLYFGNCQLAPSSTWRDYLGCEPSESNPYVWVDRNGHQVLRFERIASPVRNLMGEAYIRQPILFRWICDKKWLDKALENLNLCVFLITEQEEYPRWTE